MPPTDLETKVKGWNGCPIIPKLGESAASYLESRYGTVLLLRLWTRYRLGPEYVFKDNHIWFKRDLQPTAQVASQSARYVQLAKCLYPEVKHLVLADLFFLKTENSCLMAANDNTEEVYSTELPTYHGRNKWPCMVCRWVIQRISSLATKFPPTARVHDKNIFEWHSQFPYWQSQAFQMLQPFH